jgi:demethylmenaquinone methyltransferase / 2-methoxy-6-polyprenyl-1,4-benzoquinol methylase
VTPGSTNPSPTTAPAPVPAGRPRSVAPHGDLPQFYDGAGARADYVRDLFDRGAPEYNWVSRLMSLGTDRRYRRQALRRAGLTAASRVLDVATGTGLVARAILECGVPAEAVVGLDPSRGMLAENQRNQRLHLVQGLGENLPFRDGTFDFVVMGYALRHVADLALLFTEFRRVLRPGGCVLILEISRPRSSWGCALLGFSMRRLFPVIVRLTGGSPVSAEMIEYYWATIAGCVSPDKILEALGAAGMERVRRATTGPLLSDYLAIRP